MTLVCQFCDVDGPEPDMGSPVNVDCPACGAAMFEAHPRGLLLTNTVPPDGTAVAESQLPQTEYVLA